MEDFEELYNQIMRNTGAKLIRYRYEEISRAYYFILEYHGKQYSIKAEKDMSINYFGGLAQQVTDIFNPYIFYRKWVDEIEYPEKHDLKYKLKNLFKKQN